MKTLLTATILAVLATPVQATDNTLVYLTGAASILNILAGGDGLQPEHVRPQYFGDYSTTTWPDYYGITTGRPRVTCTTTGPDYHRTTTCH
jgi:hypothetical protein